MRSFVNLQPSAVSKTVTFPRGKPRSGFAIAHGARDIDSTPPPT